MVNTIFFLEPNELLLFSSPITQTQAIKFSLLLQEKPKSKEIKENLGYSAL